MHNTDIIQDYHAHIYFGSVTAGLAKELCENAVEQYVSRLRKKLCQHGISINAARGLGYHLSEKS